MEVTFFGVRGSIPSPGPATVRYGGNTACVLVRLDDGSLVVIDCGTGVRNLGLQLQAGEFGQGRGSATFLLSHSHWDHIQGFPFFVPFYTGGNRFTLYGSAVHPERMEAVLERQMAAQFFPVQSIRNMNAAIEMRPLHDGETVALGKARITARANPHGAASALAFRIEDGGQVLVYAGDVGYGPGGPSAQMRELYAGADLMIHDCTFSPEDQLTRSRQGASSLDDALDAALRARARRLYLIHYDQDYSDQDVDELVARGRRRLAEQPGADPPLDLQGAAEGLTVHLTASSG
jgi:phosphoribosyl 1,2-cyclic phosphodiesterase